MSEQPAANGQQQPKPRRHLLRAALARAALVLISMLVGLALVEIGLRLQQPYFNLMGNRAEWWLGRYRAHPVWHHWLRPNSVTGQPSLHPGLYPQPMIWMVNAQGCRYARDLTRAPASGTHRIIVLGDSFTEGYYQDSTFADVLEQRLNQPGRRQRYEVVNCGTSSYSPMLYYLRYKHHLSKYQPHELIVNIDLTDVYDDYHRYRPNGTWTAAGEPVETRPGARGLGAWPDNLKYRFHFARLLFGNPGIQLRQSVGPKVFEYHTTLDSSTARWREEVGFSLGMLQRLIDLTRRDSVELTLTMYPYKQHFQAPAGGSVWNRSFEQRVRELAQKNQVSFYSAYDSIKPYYGHTRLPLYWGNDFHFTPTGQLLWSRLFAEHYIRTGN